MTGADDPVDGFPRKVEVGVVRHSMAGGAFPAKVLSDVLLSEHARGCRLVILSDAEVADELNLEAGVMPCAVEFVNCGFATPLALEQVSIAALTLTGCRLAGLQVSQLRAAANLVLRGCTCSGEVRLTGAHIAGRLMGEGSRLVRPEGCALWWSSGFTILGWVLAICLVTGLGKAFKREL